MKKRDGQKPRKDKRHRVVLEALARVIIHDHPKDRMRNVLALLPEDVAQVQDILSARYFGHARDIYLPMTRWFETVIRENRQLAQKWNKNERTAQYLYRLTCTEKLCVYLDLLQANEISRTEALTAYQLAITLEQNAHA